MPIGAFNPKGPNATITRPVHAATAAAARQWYKPCTSLVANDGTMLSAQDMNFVLAQFRTAIDYYGVPDSEGDDEILKKLLVAATDMFITVPTTKTVHGAGADFPDLYAAADWLSRKIILSTGRVIFDIRPGQHVYATNLQISHPQLHFVTFRGASLLTSAISGATFPVTGANQSTDKTAQLANLRAIYATELNFISGAAIFLNGQAPVMQRLLVTTDASTPNGAGAVNLFQGAVGSDFSVHGSGDRGIIVIGGMLDIAGPVSATGGKVGILATGGSVAQRANVYCCSNEIYGIFAFAGRYIWHGVGSAKLSGNGTAGAHAQYGGSISIGRVGSLIQHNPTGLSVDQGDIFLDDLVGATSGATISNATNGIVARQGRVRAPYSTFSAMATNAALADLGGHVDLTGSTGAGTTSPANNTVGNANSYIKV